MIRNYLKIALRNLTKNLNYIVYVFRTGYFGGLSRAAWLDIVPYGTTKA